MKLLNGKTAITLGLLFLFAFLIGTSVYLFKENKILNTKVSDQVIQLKAKGKGTTVFVDHKGNIHSQSIQYMQTIDELKASKDSADQAFIAMVKDYELKIKDLSQAGQVQTTVKYVSEKSKLTTKKDTIYDLSRPPWITNKVHLEADSIFSEFEVFNNQSILWHSQRETINPPKKFFLWRWFQKKHDVTYVDIVNSNPYIHTDKQNFIITK